MKYIKTIFNGPKAGILTNSIYLTQISLYADDLLDSLALFATLVWH